MTLSYDEMTPGQKAAYTKRQRAGLPYTPGAPKTKALPAGLAEIETLARQLMTEHGLFEAGWTFGWDNATSRAGVAKWTRFAGVVTPVAITLSKPIFAKPENQHAARNVILHEIAHALVGHHHNHDWVWKATALRIGCDGDTRHTLATATPPPKFVADCACGSDHGRRLMPKRSGYYCRKTRQPLTWRPA